MTDVTVRQFFRDFKSLLPIPTDGFRVMKRKEVLFYVYTNVRQPSEAIVRQVGEMSDKFSTMPVENKEKNMGWCQLHFEKGVSYPLRKITYEDENGNAVIKEKYACEKCIKNLENKGVGRVYYL